MHILIGQAPQGAQEADQQEAFFAVDPWGSTWACRERGRTTTMSQLDRKTAKGEQMQDIHEHQGIDP